MDDVSNIILQIKLQTQDAVQAAVDLEDKIGLLKNQIANTKAEIAEYEKAQTTNTAAYANARSQLVNYNSELAKNQTALRTTNTELKNLKIANDLQTGSLNEMRAAYAAGSIQIAKFTQDQKNNDAGAQSLILSMGNLKKEILNQAGAFGSTTENVGNYSNSISGLTQQLNDLRQTIQGKEIGGKEFENLNSQIRNVQSQLNVASNRFDEFGNRIKKTNLGQSFHEIGQSVTGVVAGFQLYNLLLGDGKKKSEEEEVAMKGLAIVMETEQLIRGIGTGIMVARNTVRALSSTLIITETSALSALIPVEEGATITTTSLGAAMKIALGPIGWVIAAMGAAYAAFKIFSSDSTEFTKSNMEEQMKLVKARYDYEIELEKAAGHDTTKLKEAQLQDEIDRADRYVDWYKNKQGELTEDQEIEYAKQYALLAEATTKKTVLEVSSAHEKTVKLEEESKRLHEQTVKAQEDELKAEQEASKKSIQNAEEEQKKKEESWNKFEEHFNAVNKKIYDDDVKLQKDQDQLFADMVKDFDDMDKKRYESAIETNKNMLIAVKGNIDDETKYKLKILEAEYKKEIADAEKNGKEITSIEAKYAKERHDITKLLEDSKLTITSNSLGQLASAFQTNSTAYKALAIGQATINTYLGATKALGDGGLLGIISAAAVVAAGFADIAKIEGATFYEGGYTGKGNPRQSSTKIGKRPYTYHYDEYVVPHQVLNDPKGYYHVSALEAMRTNKPGNLSSLTGFAAGGFTPTDFTFVAQGAGSNIIDEYAQQNNLLRAMALMPPPVVSVEQYESVKSQVGVIQSRAVS